MIKALAIKELREVFGIAFLALGLYLVLVSALVGMWPFAALLPRFAQFEVPFTGKTFLVFFGWIEALFAIVVGFRQSAWEGFQNTYQFLLHRPLGMHRFFLIKLTTGFAVIVLCTSVPLLLYVAWVAVPGHHACPFEWSMTTPAWQLCFTVPLIYLGSFLSGLRPARWLGTRLLPLAGSVLPVIFLNAITWTWWFNFPVLLLLYALLVVNICHVARTRDY